MEWLLELIKSGGVTPEQAQELLKKIQAELPKYFKPAHEFNAKIEEVKQLKQQISDTGKSLDELKKSAGDSKELKAEIDKVKAEYQRKVKDYEDAIKKQNFDFSLTDALRAQKVRNPKAVKALLNVENIKLDGNKFLGLSEQIEALKQSDSYLFESDKPAVPPQGGFNPGQNTGNNHPFFSREQVLAMSNQEAAKNFEAIQASMPRWK